MPKWLQYYIGGKGSLRTPKSDYAICARPLKAKKCYRKAKKASHNRANPHNPFRRRQKAKKHVLMKHNRVWARKCRSLSHHFLLIYLIWQLWDEQACLGLAGEGGACGLPRSATPLIAPLTQHSIAGSSYCPAITSSDEDISSILYLFGPF